MSLFKWPHPQARQRALQAQAGWLEPAGRMDLIEAQLPRPCHIYKAIFTRSFTRQILAGIFGLGFLSMDAQAPLCTTKEVYSTPLLYPGGPWGEGTPMGTINGLASCGFICSHCFICGFSYSQDTPGTNKLLHA